MSARLLVGSGLAGWVGLTLLLSHVRWFSRRPIAERLRPYVAGGVGAGRRPGLLSVESFRDAVGPVSRLVGERTARLFGVSEELERRLARAHSPLDVTSFRVRQVGWSLAAFATSGLAMMALELPGATGLAFLLGSPLLAFLVLEQQAAAASAAWQRRLVLELPVIAEQLGILLSAGYSLGGALNRLAVRGSGACALDLRRVVSRIRHGLSVEAALREWAALADVPALDRLVAVLALDREAAHLSRLVGEEARAIRRDVHRQLLERIERRGQQVWIPVTVATLVPGALFLAVPFIEALRLFAE